jgi:hypothetical protein
MTRRSNSARSTAPDSERQEGVEEQPTGDRPPRPGGFYPDGSLHRVVGAVFTDWFMPDGYVYREKTFPQRALEELKRRTRLKRQHKINRRANGAGVTALLVEHGIATRPKRRPNYLIDPWPRTYTPEQRALRQGRNLRKRAKRARRRNDAPDDLTNASVAPVAEAKVRPELRPPAPATADAVPAPEPGEPPRVILTLIRPPPDAPAAAHEYYRWEVEELYRRAFATKHQTPKP